MAQQPSDIGGPTPHQQRPPVTWRMGFTDHTQPDRWYGTDGSCCAGATIYMVLSVEHQLDVGFGRVQI